MYLYLIHLMTSGFDINSIPSICFKIWCPGQKIIGENLIIMRMFEKLKHADIQIIINVGMMLQQKHRPVLHETCYE